MFQLSTFHFWLFSKEKIFLFTKHLRIQSHDLIIRTRDLSRSIPLPLILRESERSFSSLNLFIWNLGSSTSFLFTYFFIIFFPLFSFFISFFYFIPFHHSLSPIGLILSNLIHFFIERRVRKKSDWFFDQKDYVKSSVFSSFSIPIP